MPALRTPKKNSRAARSAMTSAARRARTGHHSTLARLPISAVAAERGGMNQRQQLNLFQELEDAVSQHKDSIEAILQVLQRLRSKWSMDEQDLTRKPFEYWVIRKVNSKIWLRAITIIYEAKIRHTKLKKQVEKIAASLDTKPNKLFFHIGGDVLCSRVGIDNLKSLAAL
ncbi:hypothetical protein GMDG_07970 [Pseudogymnoascus destructans 20631-21]|uniref:Uncharacterized protein n=1 Tax=Pseudogymnoascus destructans (strain ATCC MYA-4855 / 20631-21) TaxID=658429 RepID=L8FZK3_PSED2|nr:hypothetical protein GMDG_07970 [Pseudogymnoascus destructans 20631-21]